MAVRRRDVIVGGLGLGVITLLPHAAAAQDDPASARPKAGDLLVRDGDDAKTPLAAADLTDDAKPIVGWAMEPETKVVRSGSRFNRLVIGRVGDVVFAYTAICTHDGCDVTDWLSDEHVLSCPCHYSKFDPTDGGRVKDGPAPRPLPQLPIAVMAGTLVVSGAFPSKVGYESQ